MPVVLHLPGLVPADLEARPSGRSSRQTLNLRPTGGPKWLPLRIWIFESPDQNLHKKQTNDDHYQKTMNHTVLMTVRGASIACKITPPVSGHLQCRPFQHQPRIRMCVKWTSRLLLFKKKKILTVNTRLYNFGPKHHMYIVTYIHSSYTNKVWRLSGYGKLESASFWKRVKKTIEGIHRAKSFILCHVSLPF